MPIVLVHEVHTDTLFHGAQLAFYMYMNLSSREYHIYHYMKSDVIICRSTRVDLILGMHIQ